MSVSWPEVLKIRLGLFMDTEEAKAWREAVNDELHNVTDGDMLNACRAIAEDVRVGDLNKKVTANHIISKIKKQRWEARNANEPPAESCGLCAGRGWMTFFTEYDLNGPIRCQGFQLKVCKTHTQHSSCSSTFCKCSMGQRFLRIACEKGSTTVERYQELVNAIENAE